MKLTKFKLVNTTGLKGLQYKGDFIPFDKIDDTLAEVLITKTHVLERIEQPEATTVAPVVAIAESATAAPDAEAEAPATSRRARSN